MAVRIRLSRYGRLHRPYFRIVAIDGRCHREGVANEIIGNYDPNRHPKNIEIDMTKVDSWIAKGAQISHSLRTLLKFHGFKFAADTANKPVEKASSRKKKDPKKFVPATRRQLRKHQAKVKADRKVANEKAKAEHAAKKAEAAPAAETPKA
jgi:small subunit ribosomal protein S16